MGLLTPFTNDTQTANDTHSAMDTDSANDPSANVRLNLIEFIESILK